jgi:hypothetical protein
MKRELAVFGVVVGLTAVFPSVGLAQRGGAGAGRASGAAPATVHAAGSMRAAGGVVHSSGAVRSGGSARVASIRTSSLGTRSTTRTGTVTRVRMSNGVLHVTRRVNRPVQRVHQNNNFNQDFFEDTNAVPGLGFDFVHFAATHPNAFRGRHRVNLGGFIPFFSGGFGFPSVPAIVDDEVSDDIDAMAEESPKRHVHVIMQEPSASTASQPVATAPISPTEEYVFVKRDGTVFFAIAYSWENGALRYITNQGLRGTLTREALDLGATQQFNEQRGLNFHAPA